MQPTTFNSLCDFAPNRTLFLFVSVIVEAVRKSEKEISADPFFKSDINIFSASVYK